MKFSNSPLAAAAIAAAVAPATYAMEMPIQVHHRTIRVENVEVFYREAGSPDAPAILLLHGFGTSSYMFRELIPALAGEYRLIDPELPSFRQTMVASAGVEYT